MRATTARPTWRFMFMIVAPEIKLSMNNRVALPERIRAFAVLYSISPKIMLGQRLRAAGCHDYHKIGARYIGYFV